MLGAVAGVLTAPTTTLDPTMMQATLIYAFAAAVLGGIDSPFGAVDGRSPPRRRPQPARHLHRLHRRRAPHPRGAPDHPRRPARAPGRALRQADRETRMSRLGLTRLEAIKIALFLLARRRPHVPAAVRQRLPRPAVRVRRHLPDRPPRSPDPDRLHRADLARPRGVHGDRRLHDRDPDVEPGPAARALRHITSRTTSATSGRSRSPAWSPGSSASSSASRRSGSPASTSPSRRSRSRSPRRRSSGSTRTSPAAAAGSTSSRSTTLTRPTETTDPDHLRDDRRRRSTSSASTSRPSTSGSTT